MKYAVILLICLFPFSGFADARFVEAPAECHVPYDNGNVDNEFKLQSCSGFLQTLGGGNGYQASLYSEVNNLPGSRFVIDGQDVRNADDYPEGVLRIKTSSVESGTDCNIVDAGGTTYVAPDWTAVTTVYRTQSKYRVNVSYELDCSGGVQAQ